MAAVVFTQGCNFRCPFCHNASLLPSSAETLPITEEEIISFLQTRQDKLEGVVISGGEPTLQDDLLDFIQKIKKFGYLLKLDTNGSYPDRLHDLMDSGLIDFIAMDIKAPWPKYEKLAGCPVDSEKIKQSLNLIASSEIPHQFRTTFVEDLLTDEDLQQIRSYLPSPSLHRVQDFQPEHASDHTLRK